LSFDIFRAGRLDHAIANNGSVCLSVRPFVRLCVTLVVHT